MAARTYPNKAELIVCAEQFYSRVGLVTCFEELTWLGLSGHDLSGCFEPEQLPDLNLFCEENRDYHIVTIVAPGRYINRVVGGDNLYLLANKDRDPSLTLNHLLDPKWPLIVEDGISASLAMLNDVKNGDE